MTWGGGDHKAPTRNESVASLLSRTAAEPLRNVPVDAAEEGVTDNVVLGAASVPAKTANNIQMGAAKMTPRRAMDDATTDVASNSGKTATDVPADAAKEGATDDVVLGVETDECCRGTNQTEACHKQLVTSFESWHTGVEISNSASTRGNPLQVPAQRLSGAKDGQRRERYQSASAQESPILISDVTSKYNATQYNMTCHNNLDSSTNSSIIYIVSILHIILLLVRLIVLYCTMNNKIILTLLLLILLLLLIQYYW